MKRKKSNKSFGVRNLCLKNQQVASVFSKIVFDGRAQSVPTVFVNEHTSNAESRFANPGIDD